MKLSAQLQAAIDLLAIVDCQAKPADQIAYDYFRGRRYIGSHDRRIITEYVYGVLRKRALCDWWAFKYHLSPFLLSAPMAARVRLICYLYLVKKMEAQEIKALFNGQQYSPPPLSKDETKFLSEPISLENMPPWVEGDFPEWMLPFLTRAFGSNIIKEMGAFQTLAPLNLRVNLLKGDVETAKEELAHEGIETKNLPYSAIGLRCQERASLASTKAFHRGLIEIQDEGSQCAVQLLEAKPGETILDLCAGAGGKTLAIAAAMQNKGRLIATDIAEWRLKRAKARLTRAGIHNTELRLIASHKDKWLRKQSERFDRILIDVPCTGTGTWRRHPEKKWRLTLQDLSELTQLQAELLEVGASLIKPGGRIVYVTCSILRDENEDIIERFLKKHDAFSLYQSPKSETPFLQMTPYRHGTDGFFAAILEKIVKT